MCTKLSIGSIIPQLIVISSELGNINAIERFRKVTVSLISHSAMITVNDAIVNVKISFVALSNRGILILFLSIQNNCFHLSV